MVAERTRSGPVSVYGTRAGAEEVSDVETEVEEVELGEFESEVEGEDGDAGDGISGGQVEF